MAGVRRARSPGQGPAPRQSLAPLPVLQLQSESMGADAATAVGAPATAGGVTAVGIGVDSLALFNALAKDSRELVLGLKLDDIGKLGSRRIVIALNQIMVGEEKPRWCRTTVGPDRGLEGAELVGIGVDVRVKADQGGPVPARSRREHGIVDGRRFIETLRARQESAGIRARPEHSACL